MSGLYGIIIGVISNIIFFSLGYWLKKIREKRALKPFRVFWKELIKKEALIVFSTHSRKRPWNTYRISFTEAEAYKTLHCLFNQLGIKLLIQNSDVNIPFSRELMDKLKSNHLIILGSPSANVICKDVWEILTSKTKIPFTFHRERPQQEFDKKNKGKIIIDLNQQYFKLENPKCEFMPELNEAPSYEDKRWLSDYGVIVKHRNPYNEDKYLFLMMGCHGMGTLSSVKMLTISQKINKVLEYSDNDNLILMRYKFRNDELYSEDIMYTYNLSTQTLTKHPSS